MRAISLRLLFALVIFTPNVNAHNGRPRAKKLTVEELKEGVVRIENTVADIFEPERNSSHGTGFVVAPGLIFTNRHVIERGEMEAQRLLVHFNVGKERAEAVIGQLVFESPLHDFAVVAYDANKLKRARVTPLRLPAPGSLFWNFADNVDKLIGMHAIAIGNPYASTNIVNYGMITGQTLDPARGLFMQTQTPINPGNSGGPLISADTGEVLGITTAKIQGGDNVGYVIPIATVVEEYEIYRRQLAAREYPNVTQQRRFTVNFGRADEDDLRLMGLYKAIKKVVPDYWNQYHDALMVTDVPDGSLLRRDDVVLKINGELIGGLTYNLTRAVQRSGATMRVTVLRDDAAIDLDVDVSSGNFNTRRAEIDFVLISGLFFREYPEGLGAKIYPGIETRVAVQSILSSAATTFNEDAYPPTGSLLQAVNFGGRDYEIRSLSDLKRALRENRDKKFVRLRMYKGNRVSFDGTKGHDLISPGTGYPLVDGLLQTFVLPLEEVLTPFQFSMHRFRKNFDFSNTGAGTWDWRKAVRHDRVPGSCGKKLRGSR